MAIAKHRHSEMGKCNNPTKNLYNCKQYKGKSMKNTKIKAPISLLLAICDRGQGDLVESYLNNHHLDAGLIMMGKGTATTDIADIFGFGMSDRDVILCLVPKADETKILDDVTDILGIERDEYGLTMLLDLNSASSSILELCKVKI